MSGPRREEDAATPLDQAARAAWLYYVGGATQDQIAAEMGISRQRAQRLVAKAVAEGLIHVRLEHRVSRCMELERALAKRFGLKRARVAPSLGRGADPVKAIAPVAAEELERIFSAPDPLVVALGTGRTLRAMVEEMRAIDCPQHRIASLNGNMAPDGTASAFDVIMRLADKVRARHYPMPLPLVAATPEERDLFISLPPVVRARALAENADVAFVGVGEMGGEPPLLKDGFLTLEEIEELRRLGAVGEITGWSYDDSGTYLETGANARIAGVRLERVEEKLIVAIAAGAKKRPAIKAALKGGLVNGLITDELTAEAMLA